MQIKDVAPDTTIEWDQRGVRYNSQVVSVSPLVEGLVEVTYIEGISEVFAEDFEVRVV